MTTLTQVPSRARRAREGAPPRRGAGSAPLERSHRRMFWAFTAPAVLFYTVLFLVPLGYAAWTSLYKWDGLTDKKWRGLRNYQILWQDDIFRSSLTNTLKIMFIGGALTFLISFGLMLVLREMQHRMFARSVIFFPCLVNGMVFGLAAGFLFSPTGPVNEMLGWVGVHTPPKWLSDTNTPSLIIAVLIWTSVGYYTAIMMAAVDQIPEYLYEAAELDGCNAWQRFRHVTLPLSREVITVCAIMWTAASVKIFELILLFGGNSGTTPPRRTWNIAVYVYQEAFPQQGTPALGMATAAAMASLVLVVVISVVLRRVLRSEPLEY
jgi:raffinose/stachyose/melibiose transport system permease protein